MGVVLADAGERPGVATAPATAARVEQVRRSNPSLSARRLGFAAPEPAPAAS
jgi:hypothetical protein